MFICLFPVCKSHNFEAFSVKPVNGQMSLPPESLAPGGFYSREVEDNAKPKTLEALRESGITHHIEAALYSKLAREVIASKNPKFVSLQPTVNPYGDEAWRRAYDFVHNFLTLQEMSETLSTVRTEFPRLESLELRETFSDLDRDKYFHEILETVRLEFVDKVARFRGQGPET
jgi:hypothetical protein